MRWSQYYITITITIALIKLIDLVFSKHAQLLRMWLIRSAGIRNAHVVLITLCLLLVRWLNKKIRTELDKSTKISGYTFWHDLKMGSIRSFQFSSRNVIEVHTNLWIFIYIFRWISFIIIKYTQQGTNMINFWSRRESSHTVLAR